MCRETGKRIGIPKIGIPRIGIPRIGMRITKSAIAILLCYFISFLRGNSGIVVYSQLAALWCIQGYVSNSKKNALQRFIGTVIGAVYGLAFLLARQALERICGRETGGLANALAVSAFIILVLYTTVLIKKKQASYFSCVVFLSIVVNHVADANPYLFVWNRFLDTVIGICVGIGVNVASLPHKKRRDILFVSGLDNTLLSAGDRLSDYSRVELNRMLDDGVNFTISTMRTPASLMEPMRDIRLRLPVIAMDGAVLYDIREKMYLKVYIISRETARRIRALAKSEGLCCFTNVVIDDMLVIYYEKSGDEVHQRLVSALRRSPYRNYVCRELPEEEDVVYFMLLYPSQVIEAFYDTLSASGLVSELKILKYDSDDYPGYSYIKIYNKNATKENMMAYLKNMTQVSEIVTFGSVAGRCDVLIENGDSNKAVHVLKKMYEPVGIKKNVT